MKALSFVAVVLTAASATTALAQDTNAINEFIEDKYCSTRRSDSFAAAKTEASVPAVAQQPKADTKDPQAFLKSYLESIGQRYQGSISAEKMREIIAKKASE